MQGSALRGKPCRAFAAWPKNWDMRRSSSGPCTLELVQEEGEESAWAGGCGCVPELPLSKICF